jgi:ATP-dependent helicase HrpB
MQKGSSEPLPIDAHLADIIARLRQHRAIVVTAAPGAGKTTRVPPALVEDGPVLLLQPRRLAARAIAQRIASEQGWTVGREIGWHVRFDRRSSRDTRLLVATEGILTARLQQDPLLSDFRTVVLDEFHERSIHSDVGLALARQAWIARDDLRIVVMSATLDAGAGPKVRCSRSCRAPGKLRARPARSGDVWRPTPASSNCTEGSTPNIRTRRSSRRSGRV